MLRNVLIPIILLACLAASCGGGASLDRDSAKKGYDYYRALSDVDVCGCPASVRCFIVEEEGAPDCDDWEWFSDRGRISDVSADGLTAWVTMDKPGAVHVWARGVGADGKDCTTPRHKITCARGHNSPPVPLPDGPLDAGEDWIDAGDGTRYRYHDWRWTNGRSYDAEGDTFDTQFFMYASPDLDGDGDPDEGDAIMVSRAGDGSVRTADLDGNGAPDVVMMDSKEGEFIVRVLFRTIKSKEDVYVWKMVAKEKDTTRKKEFKGHVTLLK